MGGSSEVVPDASGILILNDAFLKKGQEQCFVRNLIRMKSSFLKIFCKLSFQRDIVR